jgi:3-oxoacyl-[acyl-carrier protein] reductase
LTEATFSVEVDKDSARAFAALSGDWNPLHTDEEYAAGTEFGRPILHGAFAAGLVSRMAGMHIPGKECLLHGLQLKFLQPIVVPASLNVTGTLLSERNETGRVSVEITDRETRRRYVEASYEYSRHRQSKAQKVATAARSPRGASVVLVTGPSGGLGSALMSRLGSDAIGLSRADTNSFEDDVNLDSLTRGAPIAAIVHCGWPAPDNTRLTKLSEPAAAIAHHLSQPLQQAISLSRLLLARGTPDAILLLVGSTAADPGRHNYRTPLYTLAKSLLPALCRILAVEMGASGRRCAAAVFDVVDTGMNKAMSPQARLVHESRSPAARIPTAEDAADQLAWIVANRSFLLSGATITLSGGAIP